MDADKICYVDYNGGKKVLHGDYQYHKIRDYKDSSSVLRCSSYKKTKCPGKIKVKDEHVLKVTPHKCEVDKNKNSIIKIKAALRIKVQKEDRPIPQMYNETIDGLLDEGLNFVTDIPDFQNMKHFLYDARKKSVGVNKFSYNDLKEVEVPHKFKEFLMADYSDDEDRILIFCTPESRMRLCDTKEYFIDATFKSCPKPFRQLFTIHGDFGSTQETTNVKPLIFVLMADKKQASYDKVFNLIQSRIGNMSSASQWTISKVHCDFEVAIINTVSKHFPQAAIRGCYYHWNNNIWQNGKRYGYKLKAERRILGCTAVLPLLPKERILEGWQYIKQEIEDLNLKMPKFVNYIEGLFKHRKVLSVLSVFGERHRTNNYLEGWHSKLNRLINKNTVTVLRLLNALKQIVVNSKVQIAKRISTKRRNGQLINDDVIRSIQMQLINNEISVGHVLDKLR